MDYNVMETQLTGEYRDVFAKAQLYSMLKNVADDVEEDKMLELYDLLLTAQSDDKPVEKLTGRDVNKFLKSYFEDYTWKERLRRLPVWLYRVAWAIFVLESITALAADYTTGNFFTLKDDVTGYGIGLLTAVVFSIICNSVLAPMLLRRKQKVSFGGWYAFGCVLFVVLIGISVAWCGDKTLLVMPVHPLLICSGLYIVTYLIVRSIWRYRNYGSIRNTRKKIEQDSYYRNLYDRDMEQVVMKGWKSRYERLLKKGKTTAESFIEKLKTEEQYAVKGYPILVWGLLGAVVVFAVIDVAAESTWFDTLMYAAIIGTIEYFIGRWIIRSEKKQSAIRSRIIRQCEQSDMTLPEYIDNSLAEYKK